MECGLSKTRISIFCTAFVVATVNEFFNIIAVALSLLINGAESFNKVLEDIFSEISKLDRMLLL
jgi:hypothetical protein